MRSRDCLSLAVFSIGLAVIAIAQTRPADSQPAFPQSWIGHWSGEAANCDGVGQDSAFRMELIVSPTEKSDRYGWTIIYDGAMGRQERKYALLVRDAAKGEYAIDEGDGIIIDARCLRGALYTQFAVGGSRITTCMRFESSGGGVADRLSVEMLTVDENRARESASRDAATAVRSWMPRSLQSAVLRRVAVGAPASAPASAASTWRKLETEKYPGKQDDIYFVNPRLGWYVNGAGKIFKTDDGGASWKQVLHKPGTYFRCIAFVDERVGFAGNIGPGYFPNVSDDTPLYRTEDGGETWSAVTTIDGPPVVGLCALEVLRERFVNAGNLDTRTRVYGVGRVGGPTAMIFSDDLGKSWKQIDIREQAAMAFDVHFFDRDNGIIAASTDKDVSKSHALILTTSDGGKTWKRAYESQRPFELTWKIAFPSRNVGYVTVQSYNPDPTIAARYVAKTTDGGGTWSEIPLIEDAKVREFGVAFADENTGWIGAMPGGFETTDGGKTWSRINFGNAVNKIRLLQTDDGLVGYAIGVDVYKLERPR